MNHKISQVFDVPMRGLTQSPFSSVHKSLMMVTDLNKGAAEALMPGMSAVEHLMSQDAISKGETKVVEVGSPKEAAWKEFSKRPDVAESEKSRKNLEFVNDLWKELSTHLSKQGVNVGKPSSDTSMRGSYGSGPGFASVGLKYDKPLKRGDVDFHSYITKLQRTKPEVAFLINNIRASAQPGYYIRPGGGEPGLESPLISPLDFIGTGAFKVGGKGLVSLFGKLGSKVAQTGGSAWARKKIATQLTALIIAAGSGTGKPAVRAIANAVEARSVPAAMKIIKEAAESAAPTLLKVGGRTTARTTARTAARTGGGGGVGVEARTAGQRTASTGQTVGSQLTAPTTGQTIAGSGAIAGMTATSATTAPSTQQQSQQQTQTKRQTSSSTQTKPSRSPKKKPARKPSRVLPPGSGDDEKKKPTQASETELASGSGEEAREKAKEQQEKAQREAAERAKQLIEATAKRQKPARYSTVRGERKKFKQLRASISSMSDYSAMYKSGLDMSSLVHHVHNQKISLTKALDLIPWNRQSELLERLNRHA